MKFHSLKKRYITLIEIMIVMFLIAMITGVLAYNYRGSLDKGKEFKTKAAMEKLETILNLAVAEQPGLQEGIEDHWRAVVESSPLVQNPRELIYDGWGKEYKVEKDRDGQIRVTSEGLNDYMRKARE